jgi:predicted xylose isomerase-like sugar epimerase
MGSMARGRPHSCARRSQNSDSVKALNEIGYDGPVRAEPFNQAVNSMSKEEACAVTAVALKKMFALIG